MNYTGTKSTATLTIASGITLFITNHIIKRSANFSSDSNYDGGFVTNNLGAQPFTLTIIGEYPQGTASYIPSVNTLLQNRTLLTFSISGVKYSGMYITEYTFQSVKDKSNGRFVITLKSDKTGGIT